MNYLKYDITTLNHHILWVHREYNYTFLSSVSDVIDVDRIYHYLLSTDEYKLKNIWNHFIKKWSYMNTQLKSNQKYKNSNYANYDIHYIHTKMTDDILNDHFSSFIKEDQCNAIFIINIILSLIS